MTENWANQVYYQPRERHDLQNLHGWLSKELVTSAGAVGFFFIPPRIVAGLLYLAALVFTPYMLWKLSRLRKWSWIIAFVIFVGLPALGFAVPEKSIVLKFGINAYLLVAFYLFCVVLRLATMTWLEDLKGREELERRSVR